MSDREIVEKATKGSWEGSEKHCDAVVAVDGYSEIDPDHFDYYHGLLICESAEANNVEFIAHFNPVKVGKLLDRIDALRAFAKRLLDTDVGTVATYVDAKAILEADDALAGES